MSGTTTTITNSTSLSSPITLTTGGTLSVAPRVTISSAGNGINGINAYGTLTLNNSGLIEVTGSYGLGVFMIDGTVTNAAGATISSAGNGINAVGTLTLNNSGLIEVTGSYALGVYMSDGTVTNAAGATISSVHDGINASGTLTLNNSGLIEATGSYGLGVLMRYGTVTNAAGATISGTVGVDASGSSPSTSSLTLTNYGTIASGSGTAVFLEQGVITNAASAVISSGAFGVAASSSLDLTNYGTIETSNTLGTGVSLEQGVITNAAGATISSAGNGINAPGTLTLNNSGLIEVTGSYGVFMSDGTVTNAAGATISGTTAVDATGTLDLINAGNVTGSFGVIANTLTLTNTGMIEATGTNASGVSLTDGTISNAAGATISSVRDGINAPGTLTLNNSGLIEVTGSYGLGVFMSDGTVTNAVGATISGTTAVDATGTLDLINAGNVTGSFGVIANTLTLTNAGTVKATGTNAFGVSLIDGTISNTAGATISGAGNGINASGTLTLSNSGLIEATGSYGLGVSMSDGTVTNAAGATISGTTGVNVININNLPSNVPATLVNAGTIEGSGGTAVSDPVSPLSLVIDPGAVFDGSVVAGDTSAANEITLAAGSQVGTIDGLSNYLGFSSLYVQPGATWVIDGDFGTASPSITVANRATLTVDEALPRGVNVDIQNGGTLISESVANGTTSSSAFVGSGNGAATVDNLDDNEQVTLSSGAATVGVFNNDSVVAAAGEDSVFLNGSGSTVQGTNGPMLVVANHPDNEVHLGSGAATVFASAGANTVYGGSGQTIFVTQPSVTDVEFEGGAGDVTVFALDQSSGVYQPGTAGSFIFVGVSGSASTLTGATGDATATVFGDQGSDVIFDGDQIGNILVSSGANTTLNGASSGGGDVFFNRVAAGQSATLVGGQFYNYFLSGAGNAVMVGGVGPNSHNFFQFIAGEDGGTNVITNWGAQGAHDEIDLVGYQPSQVNEQTVNGSTVITLSDGTKITVQNTLIPASAIHFL